MAGILCRAPLRSLRIFTRGLTPASAQRLRVELWRDGVRRSTALLAFHQVGTTKKQGYALPVLSGTAHEYVIALEDGTSLPEDWIIEFSDPVIGNRWGAEHIVLRVAGRECGTSVSSQHDRRYIWAGVADSDHLTNRSWGHGACTAYPPMPSVNCSEAPPTALPSCDGCEDDSCMACAAARCGPHGYCLSKFLGGHLPATRHACVCEPPWSGPTCELNPCASVAADACGRGRCVANGGGWACECETGYSGARCDVGCDGVCNGVYPYGCNAGVPSSYLPLACPPRGMPLVTRGISFWVQRRCGGSDASLWR